MTSYLRYFEILFSKNFFNLMFFLKKFFFLSLKCILQTMENQNMSITDLFKKKLIFRDHQLKKIHIKSLQFAVSLGFFQNVFVNFSNPSKIKSEVSVLMGWGIAITILILLLLHYVEVISLGEKCKQTKRGVCIGSR